MHSLLDSPAPPPPKPMLHGDYLKECSLPSTNMCRMNDRIVKEGGEEKIKGRCKMYSMQEQHSTQFVAHTVHYPEVSTCGMGGEGTVFLTVCYKQLLLIHIP